MTHMYNPPHPGLILAEGLEELGISASEFALHLGVSPSTISRVLAGKSAISPALALKISKAISGPSPEVWLKMQAAYDLWQAQKSIDLSKIMPFPKKANIA